MAEMLGTLSTGIAEIQAASFNSKVAKQNARIAHQQTELDLKKNDRERRLRAGANRAAIGASGITGGSAFDVLQDNIAQEALNVGLIKSTGQLKEANFKAESSLQKIKKRAAIARTGTKLLTQARGSP